MIHPAFAEAIFHADSIMHSVSKETEHFNYNNNPPKMVGSMLTRPAVTKSVTKSSISACKKDCGITAALFNTSRYIPHSEQSFQKTRLTMTGSFFLQKYFVPFRTCCYQSTPSIG